MHRELRLFPCSCSSPLVPQPSSSLSRAAALELQDSQESLSCTQGTSDEQNAENTQGMQDSLRPSRRAASMHRERRLFPCSRPGFTGTSTRPHLVSRVAVPFISSACSTGPPRSGTTLHSLKRSLPRGRTGKDSLIRSIFDDRIRVRNN